MEVSLEFVGLVAVIAQMVDRQLRRSNAPSVVFDHAHRRWKHSLVHHTFKTNAMIAAEQAVLRISGESGPLVKPHSARYEVLVTEFAFQRAPIIAANPLVGVDVKNPVAMRPIKSKIARRRKIVTPGIVENIHAIGERNLPGPVTRSCIDDYDFIHEIPD